MIRKIGCRHRTAKGMTTYVPCFNFGILRLYPIGGTYIQYCKIERHLHKDAQNALLCTGSHQRLIGGIFHLTAGIEYESLCGVFGIKDQGAVIKQFRGHRIHWRKRRDSM